MAPGDVALDELEAGEVQVKEEDNDDVAMAMLDDLEAEFKAEHGDVKKEAEDDGVGTSNEQTFSSGMAATLSILRQQGALQETSAEQREREKLQRKRDLWLSEQRFKIAKRELERQNARGGNRDAAQREYDNRMREVQERRQLIDDFNTGYKPDVNIVYHDEHGRELTVKEAWKALSHKFHGKTPGKMKTEKKFKRIEEERKKLSMASGDTPLSMNAAFQARQEKTGQAHFVLSVGNRGSVFLARLHISYTDSSPSQCNSSGRRHPRYAAPGQGQDRQEEKEGRKGTPADGRGRVHDRPSSHSLFHIQRWSLRSQQRVGLTGTQSRLFEDRSRRRFS